MNVDEDRYGGYPRAKQCCLCNITLIEFAGNNPSPLGKVGIDWCCDECNRTKVIPARGRLPIRRTK